MNCPECGGKTKVTESWVYGKTVLRRRTCTACDSKFETRERIAIHEPEEKKWENRRKS